MQPLAPTLKQRQLARLHEIDIDLESRKKHIDLMRPIEEVECADEPAANEQPGQWAGNRPWFGYTINALLALCLVFAAFDLLTGGRY